MLKIVNSDSVTSSKSKSVFPIPVGKYSRIAVDFSSTLAVGEGANLVASDFGHFVLREGLPSSRVRADILDAYQLYNNFTRQFDIDTDVLVNYFFEFPLRLPWDKDNILWVPRENTVFLEIEYAATLGTRIGGNTMNVDLYLEEQDGIMAYRTRFNSQDFTINSGTKAASLGFENLAKLFVENNTNITKLNLSVDGKVVKDGNLFSLVHDTLHNNNIESWDPDSITTTVPFVEIALDSREALVDLLNTDNLLTVDGAASDELTLGILTLDFTPEALRSTSKSLSDSIAGKIARKAGQRPVEVLELLQQLGS